MNEDDLPPLVTKGTPRKKPSKPRQKAYDPFKPKKAEKEFAKKAVELPSVEEAIKQAAKAIENEEVAKQLAELVDSDLPAPNTKILWQPQKEVHFEFLSSEEDEVLFSGGRGSGKSDCLLVDPLRWIKNKKFRGLIIRSTMPELRELINRAKDLYPAFAPGTIWRKQEGVFEFPSGAKIEFGYCANMDDLERYRGQEYTWLGIDELTQFESPEIIDKMLASMRSTDPTLPIHVRATTNPSGKGFRWVKERYVDKGPAGVTIFEEHDTPIGKICLTKKWLHSTYKDNPLLIQAQPKYVAQLHALQGNLREQWLEGSWDAVDGLAFSEFRREKHTCKPFAVPSSWRRFRACDWGYGRALAACLWFAIDPVDYTVYVYREFVANGGPEKGYPKLNSVEFARVVLQIEREERISYGVIDGSIDAKRGEVGPSILEQMRKVGCRWRTADRSKGSRKAGKQLIHQLLIDDEVTQKPKLIIFNNCLEIIKELSSLPVDEDDPEDVDTDAVDHAYDALRYGLMSRPHNTLTFDGFEKTGFSRKFNQQPIIVDRSFGY